MKKAEQHKNRVIYQTIPGMYNEKTIETDSVDMKNLLDDIQVLDYENNIRSIKKWILEQDEFKIEMENFMKRKR